MLQCCSHRVQVIDIEIDRFKGIRIEGRIGLQLDDIASMVERTAAKIARKMQHAFAVSAWTEPVHIHWSPL